MNSTRPVSLNFDNLPIGGLPLPASFDTLLFTGAVVQDPNMPGPGQPVGFVNDYGNAPANHYLQLSSTPMALSDTFTMSALDGSSFNLQSMAVKTYSSFTVTGYDAHGMQIATDTVVLGVPDTGGSIQFNQLSSGVVFDTLTFDQSWTGVAAVTFSSMPGRAIGQIAFDDIVLNTPRIDLAGASDSGVKGDHITNVATPVLTGSAGAEATLDVYIDGSITPVATATTNAAGTFTLDDLEFSGDGAHTVQVVARDDNASATVTFTLDTMADAPAGLTLDPTYAIGPTSDAKTGDSTPQISGTAEANAKVTLFDGTTAVGSTTANDEGVWQITASTLDEGVHALSARQTDVAGNTSIASAPLTVTVVSGRPGVPVLAAGSDSGIEGDGITNHATPTVTGLAGADAVVALYDGNTVVGTTVADDTGHWSITVGDGLSSSGSTPLSLADGIHTLRAASAPLGDVGSDPVLLYSAALTLRVDTLAPAAPAAPTLDGAGNGATTTIRTPLLHGQAEPDASVAIYDNGALVGTATATSTGTWSWQAGLLATGAHAFTAAQTDVAGNASIPGAALTVTIKVPSAPAAPSAPAPTIDGVAVTSGATTLAGGAPGTALRIPIVTSDRVEQTGAAATADIPLATAANATLLTAQVHTGFGLNASGATVTGDGLAELIATIKATGAAHGNGDVAHLTADGQSFLALLPAASALHVQSVQLIGGAQGVAVDLTAAAGATDVALVIDGTGVAAGTAVTLANIAFASVFGALSVTGSGPGQTLSGDAAAQTFTVDATWGGKVFAGGGADTLAFDATAAARAGVSADVAAGAAAVPNAVTATLLHGGGGADTAVFSGSANAYTIVRHDGDVLVSSNAAPDQVAHLVNIESLQFSDQTLALQATANQMTLAGLYESVIGRQADVAGFDFWAGAATAGTSLGAIAVDMIASTEVAARLGTMNGDHAHDVGILYEAIFGRAADSAGSAYWVAQMVHGMTLDQVADAFTHSIEIVGHQQAATAWDFSV